MKFIVQIIASLSLAGSFACDANQGGEAINELRVQRNIAVEPEKPENDLVLKDARVDTSPFTTNAPIHDQSSPKVPHDASQPSQTPLDIIGATGPEKTSPEVREDASQFAEVPSGLSLPFRIVDLDEFNGEINPIGIVRFSKDRPDIGHSGLDVPLAQGADIFAVADGEIVLLSSAGDPWGGWGIFQLLQGTRTGEGWGFIYEHVTPKPGLQVGSWVKRGEVIATKTAPAGFTAHLQLSYLFNSYEYISDIKCWPDKLASGDKTLLESWWQQYSASEHLVDSWRSTAEEGQYPFRGLLDTTAYTNGPHLCYPLGTDVR